MELVFVVHADTDGIGRAAWGSHGDSDKLAEENSEGLEVAGGNVNLADSHNLGEGEGYKLVLEGRPSAEQNGPMLSAFDADLAASATAVCGSTSVDHKGNGTE
jgi:hypothetical protein